LDNTCIPQHPMVKGLDVQLPKSKCRKVGRQVSRVNPQKAKMKKGRTPRRAKGLYLTQFFWLDSFNESVLTPRDA